MQIGSLILTCIPIVIASLIGYYYGLRAFKAGHKYYYVWIPVVAIATINTMAALVIMLPRCPYVYVFVPTIGPFMLAKFILPNSDRSIQIPINIRRILIGLTVAVFSLWGIFILIKGPDYISTNIYIILAVIGISGICMVAQGYRNLLRTEGNT